ncbi:flavin reductase (DIM6/NTAB) family NADH-FMN oxidoreductase RutF [Jatrophihabitans sp. GAS493]|uniref:flavin reductase family protein n=1 Tax=Jatrophihabitans sp. GAS493 TaxID=1907575 RepID=UPI000BB6F7B6|nr:flavin reductase family protein [Jatrophihabitans sp. GAS493]SOD71414.1 flavin reductase (DIM6/NTAB) family NADH-FMN oxidoreductase RutF [Jatrophihabitans sp. GAS493]
MTVLTHDQLSGEVLRSAFGSHPSGVTAVCATIDGEPTGLVASSFTSVSLEPPLVSVCVAHTSTTWPRLRPAARLGVSVLAADHHEVARRLSARAAERFDQVGWEESANGAVFIDGSALRLECSIENEVRAGDHDIVLLRVIAVQSYPEVAPLVFHASRFRRLEA